MVSRIYVGITSTHADFEAAKYLTNLVHSFDGPVSSLYEPVYSGIMTVQDALTLLEQTQHAIEEGTAGTTAPGSEASSSTAGTHVVRKRPAAAPPMNMERMYDLWARSLLFIGALVHDLRPAEAHQLAIIDAHAQRSFFQQFMSLFDAPFLVALFVIIVSIVGMFCSWKCCRPRRSPASILPPAALQPPLPPLPSTADQSTQVCMPETGDLGNLTVEGLRAELRRLGLRTNGLKPELIQRLSDFREAVTQ